MQSCVTGPSCAPIPLAKTFTLAQGGDRQVDRRSASASIRTNRSPTTCASIADSSRAARATAARVSSAARGRFGPAKLDDSSPISARLAPWSSDASSASESSISAAPTRPRPYPPDRPTWRARDPPQRLPFDDRGRAVTPPSRQLAPPSSCRATPLRHPGSVRWPSPASAARSAANRRAPEFGNVQSCYRVRYGARSERPGDAGTLAVGGVSRTSVNVATIASSVASATPISGSRRS